MNLYSIHCQNNSWNQKPGENIRDRYLIDHKISSFIPGNALYYLYVIRYHFQVITHRQKITIKRILGDVFSYVRDRRQRYLSGIFPIINDYSSSFKRDQVVQDVQVGRLAAPTLSKQQIKAGIGIMIRPFADDTIMSIIF